MNQADLAVVTSAPEVGRSVVISVSGEVDISTAPRMLTAVIEAVRTAPDMIVVDLADVGYMDSSGLAEMIRAHRFAGRSGCPLRVRGARPPVRRLFRATGVDRVVPCDDAPAETGLPVLSSGPRGSA